MNYMTKEQPHNPVQVQYVSRLKNTDIFSGLSDEEMDCFQRVARTCSYKKGKVIYIEEDPAKYFFIIISGWIKLFHTTVEGDEVIADMLTVGHIVGENAIFEKDRHTSSAMVVSDVQLVSLPAALLKEQIRLNPTLALNMLSSMSRHHRRHYDEIALNVMQSAPQRIGRFLLKLCPEGEKGDVVLQLPFDKALIASMLGMDGATFSRALNILRLKTNIRVSGTRVEINSVERLAHFVYATSSLLKKSTTEKVQLPSLSSPPYFAWSPPEDVCTDYRQAGHA